MALLDRNGLYGSARFHLITKSNKIKSHVGAEISVGETPSLDRPYYPLLVANRTGYQNLCRLITKTKLRSQKNKPTAATMSELEEHAEGLVCLTGDENGPLSAALRNRGKEEAPQLLERLRSIFGRNNVCVELQRHFRPEREHRNHAAIDLARELSAGVQNRKTAEVRTSAQLLTGSFWELHRWGPKGVQCPRYSLAAAAGT